MTKPAKLILAHVVGDEYVNATNCFFFYGGTLPDACEHAKAMLANPDFEMEKIVMNGKGYAHFGHLIPILERLTAEQCRELCLGKFYVVITDPAFISDTLARLESDRQSLGLAKMDCVHLEVEQDGISFLGREYDMDGDIHTYTVPHEVLTAEIDEAPAA